MNKIDNNSMDKITEIIREELAKNQDKADKSASKTFSDIAIGIKGEIINIKTILELKFNENSKEHIEHKNSQIELDKNQKITNGSVKRLKMWQSGVMAVIGVIILIFPYLLVLLKENFELRNSLLDDQIIELRNEISNLR